MATVFDFSFLFTYAVSGMDTLEDIVYKLTLDSSAIDLINFLSQKVAEKCGEEIDASLARLVSFWSHVESFYICRSSLQCRSISSSLSSGNRTHVEKRLMRRRLRSAVNYFETLPKFQKLKEVLLKEIESCVLSFASTSRNRPSTGFVSLQLFVFWLMGFRFRKLYFRLMNFRMKIRSF